MSTDAFSWLHLTDLHYGLKGQDCLWPNLREPFFESLEALHKQSGPWQIVFFTGDLVQSGASAQFAEMQKEVLDPLWSKLASLGSADAALVAVPGNHDLFRPNAEAESSDQAAIDGLLRKNGFKDIESKFWSQPNGAYRRVISNAFAAYAEWWKNAPRRPSDVRNGAIPGDFSTTIQFGDRRIGIIGLNTAFLQLDGGDYRGRLVWDAHQLQHLCEEGVDRWIKKHDVCLLLTHQGPDWLTTEAQKQGKTEIAPAGRFALHLFGHQHENQIQFIREGGSARSIRLCQARSVFGMEKLGNPPSVKRSHGYAAGRIWFTGDGAFLRLWPRVATNKPRGWRFVPDQEYGELQEDGGTAGELISPKPAKASGPSTESRSGPQRETAVAAQVLSPSIPHSTLPSRRPFFGRKGDIEKIAKHLSPEDRSWGVVLDGPGGVGKTALALEAAYLAPAEHFPLKLWITAKVRELRPDGEVQLTDHRVDDYYELLTELGKALGRDDVSRAPPEERPGIIRHALAQYRALLVLDNLESFSAEERRRLFELLSNLPASCRAIVTSRRRTDGSTAVHFIRLDKLEREAADELLTQLGKEWPPIARLNEKERDRLYAETGGNPLLITWTAGQLGRTTGRCRTINDAIQRLQEAHRLQSLNTKNDPLEFMFGDLVETFSDDEVTVISALVHFTQPAHVNWLLPLTRLSPKATETALDGLRDRALLQEDDISGTWWLPPLAARYLRQARPEAVVESGNCLADWAYVYTVQHGRRQFARFASLETAWPQLAAAFPLLVNGESERLQEFLINISYFLSFSGRWDEHIYISLNAELRAVEDKNYSGACLSLKWAASTFFERNQTTELLACIDRHENYVDAGNLIGYFRAWSLRLHGNYNKLVGNFDAAIAYYKDAINIFRGAAPYSADIAGALRSLGECQCECGQFDLADSTLHEALSIAKSIHDTAHITCIKNSLTLIYMKQNAWVKAENLARESLITSLQAEDKLNIALANLNLAVSLIAQGNYIEARTYALDAVKLFSELRSRHLEEAQLTLGKC